MEIDVTYDRFERTMLILAAATLLVAVILVTLMFMRRIDSMGVSICVILASVLIVASSIHRTRRKRGLK